MLNLSPCQVYVFTGRFGNQSVHRTLNGRLTLPKHKLSARQGDQKQSHAFMCLRVNGLKYMIYQWTSQAKAAG